MLSTFDKMIAAQRIKTLSVNIAGQLALPEIDIKKWLQNIFPILIDFHSKYGNRQFAFILDKNLLSPCETQPINIENLWGMISRGFECFCIDLSMNFCLSDLNSAEIEDISNFCFINKKTALLVCGEEVSLYNTEGRSAFFYNFVYPEVSTRRRLSLNARSYREYKTVIEEQSSKQLITKMDEIWQDRSNRILVSNRKTEKVLQTFLAKWLQDNIYDARIVTEVGKISGIDRTDIEITGINTGDQFIIEVKWMGKNANGSSYDISRLEEGIRQVCVYLDREPSSLEGCVVCYDGRKESERNNLFTLDNPIARLDFKIIWLESKSASEIGVS